MMEDNQVPTEELDEYFSRKGAVELLCEIEMSGSRYNELAQALDISTTTLSKRLNEAQEVGLIQLQAVSGEQGATHIYALSLRGLGVRHHMMDSGTVGAYQMLREAQKKFEKKAEEVHEWAVENNKELAMGPDEHLEFFVDLQNSALNSDNASVDDE